MWINGLVVTLADTADSAEALRAIAGAGPFELGERFGQQQAVLLVAPTEQDCRAAHEWAEALPGVVSVRVAFASHEDEWACREKETAYVSC